MQRRVYFQARFEIIDKPESGGDSVATECQAEPPSQHKASACIINWDDQGGKQAGEDPQCAPVCVCVCEEKEDKSRLKLPLKMMR